MNLQYTQQSVTHVRTIQLPSLCCKAASHSTTMESNDCGGLLHSNGSKGLYRGSENLTPHVLHESLSGARDYKDCAWERHRTVISSYRSCDHSPLGPTIEGSSILLTATMSFVTPSVLASCACSRVCPPRSKPVSNSPYAPDTCSNNTFLLFQIRRVEEANLLRNKVANPPEKD